MKPTEKVPRTLCPTTWNCHHWDGTEAVRERLTLVLVLLYRMVIRPTVDEVAGLGTFSSISDEHNNVHWLRALTETAFTFDVIVLDFNGKQWEVDNIDPYAAVSIGGGLIRAPKLDVEAALEKYGHEVHH